MTSSSSLKKELQKLRKQIEDDKPKPIDIKILNPSDDSDWKMIRHFPRMSKKVKDSFKDHMEQRSGSLRVAGPAGPPYDNVLGNKWHKLLKDSIRGEKTTKYSADEKKAAASLIKTLKDEMGIELLESDFHLYGYMNCKGELSPEVYFWQGDATAIGCWRNKQKERNEYVVVDWKTTRDLPNFWESKDTFGPNLHHGLLYAKLLQVHLGLDYLPSVLIVPISSDNGKDYQLGHFVDYPDECKTSINDDFSWYNKFPESLPHKIYGKASLFNEDVLSKFSPDGSSTVPLKRDTLLNEILKESATVGDLLEALGFNESSLTIISGDE